MERPDTTTQQQRSAASLGDTRRKPAAAASDRRHDRLARELTEPSEIRLDAQPEEPGYGHGV